jgi:protein TonB
MTLSFALHGAAAALLFLVQPDAEAARAPIYRVDLIAAPAGPRAAGVVTPRPQPPPPEPAPIPPRAETNPKDMPLPQKAVQPKRPPPTAATPTPAPTTTRPKTDAAAPQAGGGPTGGRGTDVASVRTEGIEFPYPGYLENIVRQIAIRFEAPSNSTARAEVFFLIRRDGSITGLQIRTRSGNYAFDLEALGAVEAAGRTNAFGPLPDGFPDDVLPVTFSFDPRVLR